MRTGLSKSTLATLHAPDTRASNYFSRINYRGEGARLTRKAPNQRFAYSCGNGGLFCASSGQEPGASWPYGGWLLR